MHLDSGSAPSSGTTTAEILSPIVDKEQPSFNLPASDSNQLSDLDSKLKQINLKSSENADKKDAEQTATSTEVKGKTTKTVVIEDTASSNNNTTASAATTTVQVRVY